jgi:GMP synthase-like glutamine amidotransferase
MKIGLLECDDVVGRFAWIEGGYREMFAALLPQDEFRYYAADRGELPDSSNECDAYLCTGSKYSVYEEHAWIERLGQFLRDLQRTNVPFVGICFGHQMLAHALGGEVAKAAQGWGAGVLEVEVLREEPWMQPRKPRLFLHHMHQDQVRALPEGSVLLARSAHCETEMFRIGDSMLGIEAHPEFTVAFSEALIRSRIQAIGKERSARALQSLRQPTDGNVVGRWIEHFLATAIRSRAARARDARGPRRDP